MDSERTGELSMLRRAADIFELILLGNTGLGQLFPVTELVICRHVEEKRAELHLVRVRNCTQSKT